jgi:tetratricopeptide (TPR) repeat protein
MWNFVKPYSLAAILGMSGFVANALTSEVGTSQFQRGMLLLEQDTPTADNASYYAGLANTQAKAGKIEDALASFAKVAKLDPKMAPWAWRNSGIVLYMASRYAEAVDPLQKSTQLDPNNAQGWYLLGVCLMASSDYQKVGDKVKVTLKAGTVEALQKAVELEPTGPSGSPARNSLQDAKKFGYAIPSTEDYLQALKRAADSGDKEALSRVTALDKMKKELASMNTSQGATTEAKAESSNTFDETGGHGYWYCHSGDNNMGAGTPEYVTKVFHGSEDSQWPTADKYRRDFQEWVLRNSQIPAYGITGGCIGGGFTKRDAEDSRVAFMKDIGGGGRYKIEEVNWQPPRP